MKQLWDIVSFGVWVGVRDQLNFKKNEWTFLILLSMFILEIIYKAFA